MVSDLSEGLKRLEKNVDSILLASEVQLTNQRDQANISDYLTTLPVDTDEKFLELNDKLKQDENRKVLMKYLGAIGGRKSKNSHNKYMLKRIPVDNVAELYSLTSKQMKNSNKKAFISTEVWKIIFYVCKKIYKKTTEEALKEIVSDWLNQAKVRHLRRLERQQLRNIVNENNMK